MADTNTKGAAKKTAASDKSAEKKERKVLTPAERIAKAEADLAALREKAAQSGAKKAGKLAEQAKALRSGIADRQKKLDGIVAELDSLGFDGDGNRKAEDTAEQDTSAS